MERSTCIQFPLGLAKIAVALCDQDASFVKTFFVRFRSGGGVSVSLDNVANDGDANQGANVHSDVEDLFGTGNADVLTGAPGPSNFIDGNGGNDTFNIASNPPDPDHVVCGDGFVTINGDSADSFSSTGSNASKETW